MEGGNGEDGLASFVDLYRAVSARLKPGENLKLVQEQDGGGNNRLCLVLGDYILGKTQTDSEPASALLHIMTALSANNMSPTDQRELIDDVMDVLGQVSELEASDEQTCTSDCIDSLYVSYCRVIGGMAKTGILCGVPVEDVNKGLVSTYSPADELNGRAGVLEMKFDGLSLFRTAVRFLYGRRPALYEQYKVVNKDDAQVFQRIRENSQNINEIVLSFARHNGQITLPVAGDAANRLLLTDLESAIANGRQLEDIDKYNTPQFIAAWLTLNACLEHDSASDVVNSARNDACDAISCLMQVKPEVLTNQVTNRLRVITPNLNSDDETDPTVLNTDLATACSRYEGIRLVIQRARELQHHYLGRLKSPQTSMDIESVLSQFDKRLVPNSLLLVISENQYRRWGLSPDDAANNINNAICKCKGAPELFKMSGISELDYLAYSVLRVWITNPELVPGLANAS